MPPAMNGRGTQPATGRCAVSEFSPPVMHQRFLHEIAVLTRAVLADGVVRDRALAERVVRLLEALASITKAHDVDEVGRCRECRPTGDMPRSWRRTPCLVYDVLSRRTRGHRRYDWRKRTTRPQ